MAHPLALINLLIVMASAYCLGASVTKRGAVVSAVVLAVNAMAVAVALFS